jgi:hypothetical protein
MQEKTINKVIRQKIDEWISSITEEKLRIELKKDVIVTGGCITSLLRNEDVNDYDVYIRTQETLKMLVEYYASDDIEVLQGSKKQQYVDELELKYNTTISEINNQYAVSVRNLKPDQIKYYIHTGGGKAFQYSDAEKKADYRVEFLSPNAISLSNKLQIVIRFWGEPDIIHKNYDFVHATNYWTYKSGLVVTPEALMSILTKQLKYQGSLYPITSIIRVRKFVKRGWSISAGEIFKMAYQVSLLDLQNIDVLEEQLIGMDVAYFSALIMALRAVSDKKKLTYDYISEIVDRVFSNDNSDIEE